MDDLAKKLAEETLGLYWKGYFNKTWNDDGKLIKEGLEEHFKEIINQNKS